VVREQQQAEGAVLFLAEELVMADGREWKVRGLGGSTHQIAGAQISFRGAAISSKPAHGIETSLNGPSGWMVWPVNALRCVAARVVEQANWCYHGLEAKRHCWLRALRTHPWRAGFDGMDVLFEALAPPQADRVADTTFVISTQSARGHIRDLSGLLVPR